MNTLTLQLWRHPRPQGAQGRCIGQTDIPVDRRRAKRLAHRIRAQARKARLTSQASPHGWPPVVHSSPLRRCADVGRWLRRWGWRHHTHPALMELDFGHWDGLSWAHIPHTEVDAWGADFAQHRPGGAESLIDLCHRLQAWLHSQAPQAPLLVIAHAGCMQALSWMAAHPAWATDTAHQPSAAQWGSAPGYTQQLTVTLHCAPSRIPAP